MSYDRSSMVEILESMEQVLVLLSAEIGRLCTSYCRSSEDEVKQD